jgi:hypothetical protein
MKKNNDMKRIILLGIMALSLSACIEAVEKTDLSRLTDDAVWNEPALIKMYFNNTMNSAIPHGESRLLGHADECYRSESTTNVAYDNFNVNKTDGGGSYENIDRWPYETIRKINRFIDHAGHDGFDTPQPMTPNLPQAEKEDMLGQMLVVRAYHYFDMVRTYGGVPLLLHEQDISSNYEELYTARAKTSECVAQIVKDLNAAIALPDASFPTKRSDGRISKAVAYALKGRVLLYYASPQFTKQTPAGTKSIEQRRSESYAACKEAYDKLKAAGYGLYAEEGGDRQTVMDNYYKMLVAEEENKEMVWVRPYYASNFGNNGTDKELRPGSSSGSGQSPTWEMVASFSNANGKPYVPSVPISTAKGGVGDVIQGTSNPQNLSPAPDNSPINKLVFWLDREPRFYAFIGYNGCKWPLIRTQQADLAEDVASGKLQHEWVFCWGTADKMYPFDNGFSPTNARGQGFFIRKFISDDRNYEIQDASPYNKCGTDWPLIRFAEVMLNYAEAAAVTNHNQEAYDMLDALRKRAGINQADNYGLGRKTGSALVLDVLNERKVELFVESHRYYDVRRWRLYTESLAGAPMLNGTRRRTIQTWIRDKPNATNKSIMIEKVKSIIEAGGIDTPEGRDAYFDAFYHVVMLYDYNDIRYNPDRQDFLRIPYIDHIQKNPTIEQTMGWTDDRGPGKFNPYE